MLCLSCSNIWFTSFKIHILHCNLSIVIFFLLGSNIMALRAKTNTYIRVPARGQDPVFIISGLKENVLMAKQEILSAAANFTPSIAPRRKNSSSTFTLGQVMEKNPRHVTEQVAVPHRIFGLVSTTIFLEWQPCHFLYDSVTVCMATVQVKNRNKAVP